MFNLTDKKIITILLSKKAYDYLLSMAVLKVIYGIMISVVGFLCHLLITFANSVDLDQADRTSGLICIQLHILK